MRYSHRTICVTVFVTTISLQACRSSDLRRIYTGRLRFARFLAALSLPLSILPHVLRFTIELDAP